MQNILTPSRARFAALISCACAASIIIATPASAAFPDKAIKIGIKAPSTYFERGRCHEQKNNIELAIADYQKAADLPAEDDYSRSAQAQAKERLAELRGRATSLNATLGSASQ